MTLTRDQQRAAEAVRKIALETIPNLETLDARNRDRLDFHDVHVDTLREALLAAYEAGRRSVADTSGDTR